MMKKYILLLLLAGCVMPVASAQRATKIRLQSISNIGLLNGSKGSSAALQTILGGYYQNSFLGIGVGLDYYRFRSVPVFADLRHAFGTGNRNVFLYGDIGYNIDWITDKNKENAGLYYQDNNYKGGLYYDAGLGYQVGFKKSDALLISAGYTFKMVKNEVGSGVCPFVGPCHDAIETFRYYLSRVVIKAGWRF